MSAVTTPGAPAGACLAVGRTWHRRLRPVQRSFSYPVLFLWLPMRQWAAAPDAVPLARNRAGLLAFHDRDHGLGGADALAWVDGVLREAGIEADGEIWLQTLPRVFGYAFKPVSFWYAHQRDGRLRAVVAEVNNTFGERHCYLLPVAADASGAQDYHAAARAQKVFHVSPFCATRGRYDFTFRARGTLRVARVNLSDEGGPLLDTALGGRLQPYTRRAAWRALARMPWAAVAVTWRIHWQALQLWGRRVPFFRQPPAPSRFVSH